MDDKGQLMGVPVKLIIALVIGVMAMGILTQFVDTADRTMLKDMKVTFNTTGSQLEVNVFDAQSQDPLHGVTISVEYPGGKLAKTLDTESNSHTFDIPIEGGDTITKVRVTRNGYIPWEGEAAVTED
ncbi:MAG: hypothetical protein ACOCTL_01150 [Candidatus Hadarchaeota archaeon]